MKLLTVVISYNRLDLLKQTLHSYRETVTGPHRLIVVDNGSEPETCEWLAQAGVQSVLLGENHYPGFATNLGWDLLTKRLRAEHLLHRSDNDVEYLPGWCDEVRERFEANPALGQLGLRTIHEEGMHPNVGGNCVVRRSVFEQVRWEERAWEPARATEDFYYTQAVQAAGFAWERVLEPCIVHHGTGTPETDPYYLGTWRAKGYGGY